MMLRLGLGLGSGMGVGMGVGAHRPVLGCIGLLLAVERAQLLHLVRARVRVRVGVGVRVRGRGKSSYAVGHVEAGDVHALLEESLEVERRHRLQP